MSRRAVAGSGRPSGPSFQTSMNVRRQSLVQKWQRVSSSLVVRYLICSAASRPMNVVLRPVFQSRMASSPAPIAPASPQWRCSTISGSWSCPLKLSRMKSTWAFTAARFRCVPPWSTKRVPSLARFGAFATYRNTFFGSTCARPASTSAGDQP